MKKQIITYVVIAVVSLGAIVGGFYGYQALTSKRTESVTSAEKDCNISNNGKTVTLKGEDNATVLSILQKNCSTEMTGQGESAFINSINGLTANSSNEFWSFKVNGEMATVGAGSYMAKNNDTITWELSSF
jgi:hypothetical protein